METLETCDVTPTDESLSYPCSLPYAVPADDTAPITATGTAEPIAAEPSAAEPGAAPQVEQSCPLQSISDGPSYAPIPAPPLVAHCVAGIARTFTAPVVYRSFKRNLVDAFGGREC